MQHSCQHFHFPITCQLKVRGSADNYARTFDQQGRTGGLSAYWFVWDTSYPYTCPTGTGTGMLGLPRKPVKRSIRHTMPKGYTHPWSCRPTAPKAGRLNMCEYRGHQPHGVPIWLWFVLNKEVGGLVTDYSQMGSSFIHSSFIDLAA